jgi:hypothetical protein
MSTDSPIRTAWVTGADSIAQVAAYLPANYRVAEASWNTGTLRVRIAGRDDAGWTLDGYVLPRLASGLIFPVQP